ncbi:MAG: type III secretion system translocon subunit SctB [Ramlibacter sp.]
MAAAGLTGTVNLNELDGQQLLALHEKVQELLALKNSNPAAGLEAGNGLSSSEATQSTARLSLLQQDDVKADIYSFMALFAQMAQSMRNSARATRTAETNMEISAKLLAVDKMAAAAEKRFVSSMIQGVAQVVGGVIQVGASVASVGFTVRGAKAEAAGRTLLKEVEVGTSNQTMGPNLQTSLTAQAHSTIAAGARQSAIGSALTGSGTGMSSMLGGIGTMASAATTKEADAQDQARARLDVEAKVHETAVQHSNEMMQQMMDIIRDVREKLQSIEQAALQTNSKIMS